ncbi:ubiA prenyltransferase domain-containing protein 1 homolog [Argonauta hians]
MAIWKEMLKSVRGWSFSASIIPSVVGIIEARNDFSPYRSTVLIFSTLLTVVLIHAAGNLNNTFCDFINGVDRKGFNEDPTLTDGKLTKDQVLNLMVTCYVGSLFSFAFVVIHSSASNSLLISLYILGVASSLFYTSWIALKYKALGDLLIFFTFGPLIAEFSYVSCGGVLSRKAALLALPTATNAVAILHANNMRDEVTDAESGILTLPMVLGPHNSRLLMSVLLLSSYTIFLFLIAITGNLLFVLPALTAPIVVPVYNRVQRLDMAGLPETLAKLHLIQGLLYCFVLLKWKI